MLRRRLKRQKKIQIVRKNYDVKVLAIAYQNTKRRKKRQDKP